MTTRYIVVTEPAEGATRLHVIDTQPGEGFTAPLVVASAGFAQRGALNQMVFLANEAQAEADARAVEADIERRLREDVRS